MYPDSGKIDKQFKHAERLGIPYVVKEIVGDIYTVKDIKSGEQIELNFENLTQKLK